MSSSEPDSSNEPNRSARSVTLWLRAMRAGDGDAIAYLWRRYHHKLLREASKQLRNLPSRAIGGEDIASTAFMQFCRAAEEGRLEQLGDRKDLWRVLLKITLDKAVDALRRESAQRRGGGVLFSTNDDSLNAHSLADEAPTPEMATIFASEYVQRMRTLDRDDLREIAELRLYGYSNQEVAERFKTSERTIERRLQLIRHTWTRHRDES